MPWHFVNSMTWESATHRVRRIGNEHWIAVRKAVTGEAAQQIGERFSSQQDAQSACDADAAGMGQP
jgi:hypothetical protein